MKFPFLVALLTSLFLQAAPPPAGSIEGYVVAAGSSRAIANASVYLGGPSSNRPVPLITGTADADGHFLFQNVPAPGASYYRVGASADGFDSTFNETPFRAGQSLHNVVVTLMTGGNIRGRITDPSGAPVAGVTVFVYRESHIWTDPPRYLSPYYVAADGSGNLRSVDRRGTDADLGQPVQGGSAGGGLGGVRIVSAAIQTDANGNYFLRRIPPAKYFVGVEFPPGYTPNPKGLATTFYPGVVDSTKARPIVIEPETNVTGIDFTVQKPPRFTVSGRIENPNGSGLSVVVLHPPGADRKMAPSWYARTSPDGRFNIPNVFAGSYELSVDGRNGSEDLSVVVRGNVTGLTLLLPRMTSIAGTFTIKLRPGEAQLPGPAHLAMNSPKGRPLGAQLMVPGPFVIPSVASGTAYLYQMLGPTGYLLDVHQVNHDVQDDHRIQTGNNAAPLTVVARPADYGKILGTIPARVGMTRLSEVLLVPDGPRRQNALQYYAGRTKYDGAFTLDNVVPGNYKLFAWEFGRVLGLDAYMSSALLASFEKYGVSVVVPPNGNVAVKASVIPRQASLPVR